MPEFSWGEYFFYADFHQNDIGTDLTDFFPWNDIFLIRSQKSAEAKRSWHHDGTDAAGFWIQNQVTDSSQPFAVAAVYDIFFF